MRADLLGPVDLRVADVDLAHRFYTRMLGLRALADEAGRLVLTADGDTSLIRLEAAPGAPPRDPRTTGLYHVALLLPGRAELGRLLRNLASTRWPLQGLVDHGISEAIYLADPEGNGIELACDYPSSTWDASLAGLRNTPLDVERMLRAAGEAPWEGIDPQTRVGHVHLHVRDVAEAFSFYRDTLGFETRLDLGGMGFVARDGYHHHVGFNAWAGPRPPAPGAVGLVRWTLRLSEAERRAVLMRTPVVEEAEDGPVVVDPSGNRVALAVTTRGGGARP